MSITAEHIIRLTEKIVAEKGQDFHPSALPDGSRTSLNESNQYFETDHETPRCLVGHILVKLGKTERDLSPKHGGGDANFLVFRDVVVSDLDLTDEAQFLLEAAQDSQDHGSFWGPVLEEMQDNLADVRYAKESA